MACATALRGGMVSGMATRKITIALPDHQLEEIRKRVASGHAPSISGFVQECVQKTLDNSAAFSRYAGPGFGGNRRAAYAKRAGMGPENDLSAKTSGKVAESSLSGITFDAAG